MIARHMRQDIFVALHFIDLDTKDAHSTSSLRNIVNKHFNDVIFHIYEARAVTAANCSFEKNQFCWEQATFIKQINLSGIYYIYTIQALLHMTYWATLTCFIF